MSIFKYFVISIFAVLSGLVFAQKQPIEVGLIQWQKNYQQALKHSQKSNKPIFALFQEVPGCSGCKKFGREVLSHPLLVEAIENEFIPLLVYNNRFKDKALLKKV